MDILLTLLPVFDVLLTPLSVLDALLSSPFTRTLLYLLGEPHRTANTVDNAAGVGLNIWQDWDKMSQPKPTPSTSAAPKENEPLTTTAEASTDKQPTTKVKPKDKKPTGTDQLGDKAKLKAWLES